MQKWLPMNLKNMAVLVWVFDLIAWEGVVILFKDFHVNA